MSMNVGGKGAGFSSNDPEVTPDINATPLIDVMLVLLVMLIITIPMQMQAVKMDMPSANPTPPSTPPVAVTVEIDFDGTIIWDGQTVPDRATLDQKLTDLAAQPNPPELHIKPNKLASYKYVAAVMASAQRLGIKQMGLVGNEQFIQ